VETKPMNNAIRAALTVAGALTLGACATSDYDSGAGSSGMRQASSTAESACMAAVNSQYGGKVSTLNVVSSEFSQANSSVTIDAVGVRGSSRTERWRCLVSNDGKVQDLSVAQ
jgi:hypothetical protein